MALSYQVKLNGGSSVYVRYPDGFPLTSKSTDESQTEFIVNAGNFTIITKAELELLKIELEKQPSARRPTIEEGGKFLGKDDPLPTMTHDQLDQIEEREWHEVRTRYAADGTLNTPLTRAVIMREAGIESNGSEPLLMPASDE